MRSLKNDPTVWQPEQLYSLFEAIDAMQTNFRDDLRREDSDLFAQLPAIFLLSFSPKELQQPGWKTRVAGLMMVNVDPNLQASSFVQGWAMEDPKQQKDGPGVAMNSSGRIPTCRDSGITTWSRGFTCATPDSSLRELTGTRAPAPSNRRLENSSAQRSGNVKSVPTTFAKLLCFRQRAMHSS